MRLSLLDDRDDLPRVRTYAIDEEGFLWLRFDNGSWGRGCLAGADALVGEPLGGKLRHVFLRPHLAHGWPPLTLTDFVSCGIPSTERSVA